MSARELVQAAVAARLGAVAGLAVFDAPPVRAAVPYAVVDDPAMTDWSTKSWEGRETRVVVRVIDEGERPVRLRALLAQVEAGVVDLPGELGGGWRVARAGLVRSRVAKAGERWTATVEVVVRMWRDSE